MTDTERRLFAFRRYHGIGPNGRMMEEWTQQEIADYLGVSRQAVDRWLNREPLPVIEDWGHSERMTLYSIAVTGSKEDLMEYLVLLEMEKSAQSESRNSGLNFHKISSTESVTLGLDPTLGEEFSPW